MTRPAYTGTVICIANGYFILILHVRNSSYVHTYACKRTYLHTHKHTHTHTLSLFNLSCVYLKMYYQQFTRLLYIIHGFNKTKINKMILRCYYQWQLKYSQVFVFHKMVNDALQSYYLCIKAVINFV